MNNFSSKGFRSSRLLYGEGPPVAEKPMWRVGELLQQRLDRIVIENQMLKAGFAALPYLVMRDNQLSIGARLAYAFLLMYAWQEDSCFAGQEKMAEDMGVSRAQLQRYLYELREADYIRVERQDKRFNNTYVILDKQPTKLKRKHKMNSTHHR